MTTPDVLAAFGFRHAWAYWLFYAMVAWWLAWAGYWSYARSRRDDVDFVPWPWHRVAGVAMVMWPFVKLAYNVYLDFSLVLQPGTVAAVWPADSMWATVRRRSIQYVLLPLVGLWLASGLHLRSALRPSSPRTRTFLSGISLWPRTSLARDLAHGAWLFVVLYFGYLALAYALSPLQRFDTGDDSAVFREITPTLALALALTAGITEELLFRGILQTQLRRIMPVWGAIGIQSIFFGLIHSGYGTIAHIVFPVLFGLAMGLLVQRFGLLPAIMIHSGVNLVIFLATAGNNGHPWTFALIPWIFVLAVVYPGAHFTLHLLRRGGLPTPTEPGMPAAATSGTDTAQTRTEEAAAARPPPSRRNP